MRFFPMLSSGWVLLSLSRLVCVRFSTSVLPCHSTREILHSLMNGVGKRESTKSFSEMNARSTSGHTNYKSSRVSSRCLLTPWTTMSTRTLWKTLSRTTIQLLSHFLILQLEHRRSLKKKVLGKTQKVETVQR